MFNLDPDIIKKAHIIDRPPDAPPDSWGMRRGEMCHLSDRFVYRYTIYRDVLPEYNKTACNLYIGAYAKDSARGK